MHTKQILITLITTTVACAVFANGAAAATTTYTLVDLGPGPNGKDAYAYSASASAQGGTYFVRTYSCGKGCTGKVWDAVAWAGPGSTPVDITPSNYVMGWAYGAGKYLVGTLLTPAHRYFGPPHAAFWPRPTRSR